MREALGKVKSPPTAIAVSAIVIGMLLAAVATAEANPGAGRPTAIGIVRGPAKQGTGTLVGRAAVLTSAHVLDEEDGEPSIEGVWFHTGGRQADRARVTRILARGEASPSEEDWPEDWVLLELDRALGDRFGSLPFAEAPVREQAEVAVWGFSRTAQRLCRTLSHEARAVTDLLLLSPRNGSTESGDWKGYSGAPVLVAGADDRWQVAGLVLGSVRFSGNRKPDRTLGLALAIGPFSSVLERALAKSNARDYSSWGRVFFERRLFFENRNDASVRLVVDYETRAPDGTWHWNTEEHEMRPGERSALWAFQKGSVSARRVRYEAKLGSRVTRGERTVVRGSYRAYEMEPYVIHLGLSGARVAATAQRVKPCPGH